MNFKIKNVIIVSLLMLTIYSLSLSHTSILNLNSLQTSVCCILGDLH